MSAAASYEEQLFWSAVLAVGFIIFVGLIIWLAIVRKVWLKWFYEIFY